MSGDEPCGAVAFPCAAGAVPANRGIGIRIPSTQASESAWEAGHRAARVPALVGGIVVICTASITVTVPAFASVGTGAVTAVLLGTPAWAVIRAHQAASRFTR
ncbi:SdpI family protein [Subtercola endophyticus]|uniref:SdpI family protein n=1 Tax=Subtercola endophyticus TaxID=2895559 RepID=UPI0036F2BD7E